MQRPGAFLSFLRLRWRGINVMNETTIDVDQTDEDILTYEVSDEALEAAARTERRTQSWVVYTYPLPCC